jgi:hypothetical protein
LTHFYLYYGTEEVYGNAKGEEKNWSLIWFFFFWSIIIWILLILKLSFEGNAPCGLDDSLD